ncbi:hypothetical protein F5Y11DRAFT_346381 [Daldinia sp. FL1419]|nr:hypothetical protein F5Y11DRAFT_346381 [Daldinia sp. FL1419]
MDGTLLSSTTAPKALTSTLKPVPQTSSLFLTALIPEIRIIIYEYVFECKDLHIFIYEQQLVSMLCKNPTAIGIDGHENCIGMPMSRSPGMGWNQDAIQERLSPSNKRHVSALLAVCCAIYLESVDILYERYTLHFSNLFSISVFPRAMIPHHLDMLHHVRLSLALFNRGTMIHAYFNNSFSRSWPGWDEGSLSGDTPWDCAWNAIGELTSLHSLLVTIEVLREDHGREDPHWHRSMSSDFEASLLQPMKQVKCDNFLLRVNWPSTRSPLTLDEYPFQIQRFTSTETQDQ